MSSSRERLRSAERAGFRSWITKTLDDRSRLLFGGPGGADKSGSLRAPEQHSILRSSASPSLRAGPRSAF